MESHDHPRPEERRHLKKTSALTILASSYEYHSENNCCILKKEDVESHDCVCLIGACIKINAYLHLVTNAWYGTRLRVWSPQLVNLLNTVLVFDIYTHWFRLAHGHTFRARRKQKE